MKVLNQRNVTNQLNGKAEMLTLWNVGKADAAWSRVIQVVTVHVTLDMCLHCFFIWTLLVSQAEKLFFYLFQGLWAGEVHDWTLSADSWRRSLVSVWRTTAKTQHGGDGIRYAGNGNEEKTTITQVQRLSNKIRKKTTSSSLSLMSFHSNNRFSSYVCS